MSVFRLPPGRTPDFSNLLAVLQRKAPPRPTLFEFFLHPRLYERLAGPEHVARKGAMPEFDWWFLLTVHPCLLTRRTALRPLARSMNFTSSDTLFSAFSAAQ
jgi:hypothetical protein